MNTLTTPDTVSAYDSFGVSVSIKENGLAIGADVGGNSSQGVVHSFVKSGSTWAHENIFIAADGADGDRFGNSVVIYDEWLFVGAFLQDRSGKVYVYVHGGGGWVLHSELLPLVRVTNGYFGNRVRAKEYTLMVSHPSAKVEHEVESGNVNIFNILGYNWVLGNVLTPEYPSERALHGFSVDFDRGDQMIVGAPKEGPTGYGYIYIFHDGQWNVHERVVGLSGADVGHAVAMNNGHAAMTSRVGGPTGNGYVVTFKYDTGGDGTWIQSDNILVGDAAGEGTSYYGNDVAIHNDILVVGSPFEGATGAVYVYHWWEGIGWNLQHKLIGPMPGDGDWYHSMFGWSMDMHDDTLVVGAPGASTTHGTQRAGSVFLFTEFVFTKPPTDAPTDAPTRGPTDAPTAHPTGPPVVPTGGPVPVSVPVPSPIPSPGGRPGGPPVLLYMVTLLSLLMR